ncbi:DUF488 family protein, N3 subclade [Aminobacterium mobile]|uniref:DUF488 family protein, N3 subclade n=1 Tax=Aminobacterium mobile TaxID=81467 RepID=UPI003315D080
MFRKRDFAVLRSGKLSFEKQYQKVLQTHLEELRALAEMAKTLKVTLLYSSKNNEQNNVTMLKEFLESMEAM